MPVNFKSIRVLGVFITLLVTLVSYLQISYRIRFSRLGGYLDRVAGRTLFTSEVQHIFSEEGTSGSNLSMMPPLKYLVVSPMTKHTATVIFVHGLGDTGYGWKPVADMFRMELPHVKWVLPHAPTRPVTANMGMEMPSWFDIYSFGFNTAEDGQGMLISLAQLDALIKSEIDAGIPASRIVLGGFSQGAAMTILTGLTGRAAREAAARGAQGGAGSAGSAAGGSTGGEGGAGAGVGSGVGGIVRSEGWKLAGLAVLSGWLPLRDKMKSYFAPWAPTVPLFWGHGTADPLVKYPIGRESAEFLVSQLGIPVVDRPGNGAGNVGTVAQPGLDFHPYEGIGHSTNQQELDDLKDFIQRCVPN